MKKLTGIVFHDKFHAMDQASPRITMWQDGSIDKRAKPALLIIAEEGEQLPEVPEWISVEDRLPERGLTVLAWDPACLMHTMRYYPEVEHPWRDNDPSDDGSFSTLPNVTHWMPLPKAPHQ